MYLTEKELFSQYDALSQTYDQILSQSEEIKTFFKSSGCASITFIGCGSSYSLAKSAALAARLRLNVPTYSFSAGDVLLNFDRYTPILRGTLLVSISRSGSTSEVVLLVEKAKKELGIPCVSLCAKVGSAIGAMAGLNVDIPWAFDESVCQTRCVTNLYLATMMFAAILSGDSALLRSLKNVIAQGPAFIKNNRDALEKIAQKDWNNAVVLADGELEGIAEEGSLAFTEICLLHSHYFHLLDVRHGPIVLIDDKTLVIAALSPDENHHQDNLLKDIKARGATLVVFSDRAEPAPHADLNITVPTQEAHAANGIPLIFLPQALSFFKALATGVNPDAPTGLDPWIKL